MDACSRDPWQELARGARYTDHTGRIMADVEESLVRAEWDARVRGVGSIGAYDTKANAKTAVEEWIREHRPAVPA